MQITFCGAARMVTGSCHLIETEQGKFIVDCGMFQGGKAIQRFNDDNFLFNPGEIDFMLLTHAHIDHSGLIPKLVKQGYKNPIYTTKATKELSQISLPDAGHIQEAEAEWRNRKNQRKGLPNIIPLYTVEDAEFSLKNFASYEYDEEFEPLPGVKICFRDAGHIMGSALIEIWVTEKDETIKLVFSGDLGQKAQPIINDPTYVKDADYVVIESTYGNRLHEEGSNEDRISQLEKVVLQTIRTGGNLIIPAFAVGRTQDLLYHLKNLITSGKIPQIPIFIDSPMAVSVTQLYHDNLSYYDLETQQMIERGENPFEFESLHFVRTVEESKNLNETAKRSIIISASGMCEAGRVLHHLKHNLWRPEAHILFVGYQAEGTLGRRLLEGAKLVKIMGEEVDVRAQIHNIDGFSAHADRNDLLDWLNHFEKAPRSLFVVHGEPNAQQELAAMVQRMWDIKPEIPTMGETFELNSTAHVKAVRENAIPDKLKLDRTLTDLEHIVLEMRARMLRDDLGDSKAKLAAVRLLLDELEENMEEEEKSMSS